MRLFVAIDMPAPVRAALEKVTAALPFGRIADPDTLHLTLAFLGERNRAEAEAAHEALLSVALRPFDLQPGGLGTFGAPDVLWAGVREAGPVSALASRVHSALHGAGLPLERRRFRPHVTLARFDRAVDAARLAAFLQRWDAFPCPSFRVRRFTLYRSTLTGSGAVHEALADYPEDEPDHGM